MLLVEAFEVTLCDEVLLGYDRCEDGICTHCFTDSQSQAFT